MNLRQAFAILAATLPFATGRAAETSGTVTTTTTATALTTAPRAMVAAADPLAAEAGLVILKSGGNAMDAAVAMSLALTVVEPSATSLGGGGFLVAFRAKDKSTLYLDFRETAPKGFDPKVMLVDGATTTTPLKKGPHSIATPGLARGLAEAHAWGGKLPWFSLPIYAARLAEGHAVSPYASEMLEDSLDTLLDHDDAAAVFLEGGTSPRAAGTTFSAPALAKTLRALGRSGPDAVHGTTPSRSLAAAAAKAGSTLSAEDISGFKPVVRDPIRVKYRGHDIVVPSPASGGGLALALMLAILEPYDLKALGPDSPEFFALLLAAQREAYAAASANVADPAFHKAPLAELLAPKWADAARARMPFSPKAQPKPSAPKLAAEAYAPTTGTSLKKKKAARKAAAELPGEREAAPAAAAPDTPAAKEPPGNTTAMVAIDAEGNAVSLTQTIGAFFGSGVLDPATGILLNNEMYDFSASAPNDAQPGKKPRSNICPTLVMKDGKVTAALGSPGGTRIPMAVAQVLIRKIDFGMGLQAAVDAPRVFFDPERDRIAFESRIPIERIKAARAMVKAFAATKVESKDNVDKFFGGLQAVWIDAAEGLTGGADPRRNGVARGL